MLFYVMYKSIKNLAKDATSTCTRDHARSRFDSNVVPLLDVGLDLQVELGIVYGLFV